MKRKKASRFVPRGLDIVAVLDIDFEYLQHNLSLWIPIYQCPKTKEYVSCFVPEKNVEILVRTQDFSEINHKMKQNLNEYKRNFKN